MYIFLLEKFSISSRFCSVDVCQQSKTASAKGNSHHKQLHNAQEQLQALLVFMLFSDDIDE